jgi:hypothetical protein
MGSFCKNQLALSLEGRFGARPLDPVLAPTNQSGGARRSLIEIVKTTPSKVDFMGCY